MAEQLQIVMIKGILLILAMCYHYTYIRRVGTHLRYRHYCYSNSSKILYLRSCV